MIDVQDVFMTAPHLCRRNILLMAAAVLLPVAAQAPAHADSAAVAPVHQLIDGLTRVMKAGRATPFAQRFDMLAPVIDQTLDLSAILKASVGSTWDNLPPDQQATLMKAFRRYTVASYVDGFDENNEHFVINPEPRTSGDEQVVRIQIIRTTVRNTGWIMLCAKARRAGGSWMFWRMERSAASRCNGPISAS